MKTEFKPQDLSVQKEIAKQSAESAKKPSSQADSQRQQKLIKACQEFESIFIGDMLKTMRSSFSEKSGLFGGGMGSEIFQDMFDTELAKHISTSSNGMGLSRVLYKSLSGEEAPETDSDQSPFDDLVKFMQASSQAQNRSWLLNHAPEMFQKTPQPPPVIGSTSKQIRNFHPQIARASQANGVDPALVYAVIHQESSGNPEVVSSKGAKGLMQLMDPTAKELGVADSLNPEQNIQGGTKYLRQMLDRFEGDLELALAAYNAGPGTVERYGGIPPYTETQNYVKKVKQRYEMYRSQFEKQNS